MTQRNNEELANSANRGGEKDYIATFPEFDGRQFLVMVDEHQPLAFVAEAAALGVRDLFELVDGDTLTVSVMERVTESSSEFTVVIRQIWDAHVICDGSEG